MVIVPIGGAPATLAAKSATSTIPIIFNMSADPVELGLVASLNRPGGNITGVAMLGVEMEAKRLELVHELVLSAGLIAMLVNPSNAQIKSQLPEVQRAADAIGKRVLFLNVTTERELEAAFDSVTQARAGAPPDRPGYILHEPADLDCDTGGPARGAGRLCMEFPCRGQWPGELRDKRTRTAIVKRAAM
jgi:ABC transporter substrate binding protein